MCLPFCLAGSGLFEATHYCSTVLVYSVALLQATVLLALLQPAPETFELFDDIMLLSEGASCSVAADVLSPPRTDTTGIFQHALSGRLSANGHVNRFQSSRGILVNQ